MTSLLDRLAPPRLGSGFRWLLASVWVSNLGDGIAIAAGPLLVASQTDEAFLVALAALLQWLPPLLFGLFAGAIADHGRARARHPHSVPLLRIRRCRPVQCLNSR